MQRGGGGGGLGIVPSRSFHVEVWVVLGVATWARYCWLLTGGQAWPGVYN